MGRIRVKPIRIALLSCLALAGSVLAAPAADSRESAGWNNPLDPELSRWETWIGVPHSSVLIDWDEKSDDVATGGRPLGLDNDPLGVFSCRLFEGEPVLFVSGQVYGGLTTRGEYSDYHLQLQVRWGEKKLPPRANAKRDSGLLLHCVGPHGAFWNVWMRCLECQIQEGDLGDFFALAGANARVRAVDLPDSDRPRYEPVAPLRSAITRAPSRRTASGTQSTCMP